MKIVFTLHAMKRLEQRKIPEEEIIDALKKPDSVERKHGKYYFQKKLKNGTIEVCPERAEIHIKIVTTYWL